MTEQAYRRAGYQSPISATDVVIEYGGPVRPDEGPYAPLQPLEIVLIERGGFPPGVAICGGFHEHGLDPVANAVKEVSEETGLEVVISDTKRPWVYGSPDRDPRAHIMTHVYRGVGYGVPQGGDDARSARRYSIPEVRDLIASGTLAFDHDEILFDYLNEKGLLDERLILHGLRKGWL